MKCRRFHSTCGDVLCMRRFIAFSLCLSSPSVITWAYEAHEPFLASLLVISWRYQPALSTFRVTKCHALRDCRIDCLPTVSNHTFLPQYYIILSKSKYIGATHMDFISLWLFRYIVIACVTFHHFIKWLSMSTFYTHRRKANTKSRSTSRPRSTLSDIAS